jgi:hypothetical protein
VLSAWGCSSTPGDGATQTAADASGDGNLADASMNVTSSSTSSGASSGASSSTSSGTSSSGASSGASSSGTSSGTSSGADSGSDAAPVVDAGVPIVELYLLTKGGMFPQFTNDLVIVDVTKGAARIAKSADGANALCYASGQIFVARGGGLAEVSVFNVQDLSNAGTLFLDSDPVSAVFSADCSHLYMADVNANIQKYALGNGTATALGVPVAVPLPTGTPGTPQVTGLALDPSETHLGVTVFSGATSSVALLDSSWNILFNVASQAIATSNCSREAMSPSFSPDGALLATYDPNCGAYDVYSSPGGQFDTQASARYTRPDGASFPVQSVWDHTGQVWTASYQSLYMTSHGGAQNAFLMAPLFVGNLGIDKTRSTIYFFAYDPHANGAFTIDLASGAAKSLGWDLSLIASNSNVEDILYVSR